MAVKPKTGWQAKTLASRKKKSRYQIVNSSPAGAAVPRWSEHRHFQPPPSNVTLLQRAHLASRLEDFGKGRLILLSAPAGFGKTVLASLVYERLRSVSYRCAWLTLSEEHNAVAKLRQSFNLALTLAAIPTHPFDSVDLADHRDPTPEHQLLDALFTVGSRSAALFIDGLEKLTSSEALTCIQRLMQQVPSNTRLVVTSRRRSIVDISRLHAAGNVLEFEPYALQFNEDEAESLLSGLVDRPRLQEVICALDGWPVAIQLARQFLQRFPGTPSVTKLLSEAPDSLASFIDYQVLAGLSQGARNFLVCGAALQTQSGELVDAARGTHEQDVIRTDLAHLDPLIRISAAEPVSIRPHPAIAARLRCWPMSADARRALHARAADWLFARNEAPTAVKHLVAAGDVPGAVRMLERVGLNVLLAHLGPPQLKLLLRILPAQAFASLPRARIVWISMLLNDGRREEAGAELSRLKIAIPDVSPADREAFNSDLATLESFFAVSNDAFVPASELDAAPQTGANYDTVDALSLLSYQQRGKFHKALDKIEHLSAIAASSGHRFDLATLRTYRGLIDYGLGDLAGAAGAYAAAAALDPGAGIGVPSLMIDVPYAELQYERDVLVTATEVLSRHDGGGEVLEDFFDIYAARMSTRARLMCARSDVEGAATFLRNEAAIARQHELPARHAFVTATAIEIMLQTGRDPSQAQILAEELPASLSAIGEMDILPWRLIDAVMMARARVFLSRGDATSTLELTRELAARWDEAGLARGSIRARTLAAAASARLGDENTDILTLQAIELAQRTRHVRVLLDERALLATLLTRYLKGDTGQKSTASLQEWTAGVIRRLDAEERTSMAGPAMTLSARERDVLIGLSQGHTNKMIALACGITSNTVKHHLRRVYAKLKVRRRVQAVEEARRRSLIP